MKPENQSVISEIDSTRMQPVSNFYKNYVLLMLTVVYIFNFIDRQILVVLQESIKRDLELSDTQLGLLSGLSFAIFYVLLGIPIARLADKSNRKNIITASLVIWSGMTAACGMVQNFYHLLLARIGVGVGEAGCSPPAHAMISDYFSSKKRATALSVYSMGIYIGILFGFSLGGWLDSEYGWRIAFLSLGLPGVVFALIFFFSVKEPQRKLTKANQNQIGASHKQLKSEKGNEGIIEVFIFLFSKKSFLYLSLAAGLHTFSTYALGNWLPSFLSRIHGLPSREIGLYAGLIIGLAGATGTIIGGFMADRLSRNDKSWYIKVSAYGAILALPFLVTFYFHSSIEVVLTALFIGYACISTFLGPSIAITHSLVPSHMRAFSSSVLFLVLNLVGLGLGPLTVGIISDYLQPELQEQSLRWALASTLFVSLIAIVLFFKAAKYIGQDLNSDD